MKISIKHVPVLLFGVLAFSFFFHSSCKKECLPENGKINSSPKTDKQVTVKANEIYKKMTEIRVVGDNFKKQAVLNLKDGSFSFADPDPGYNFSSSDGAEYVANPEGGGTLYISASAFGSNAGGGAGTVVAGTTNLEINYTFCFSADDSSSGFSFFGPEFDGVSMVIGLSGDLEALASGADTSENPLEFFNGFAVYVVFDSPASGSYDVINWVENIDADSTSLEGNAFAYVLDFQNPAIYLSSEGSLNVSDGSIGFNGKYFRFVFDFLDEDDDDIDSEESFSEVDGFGTMGCS